MQDEARIVLAQLLQAHGQDLIDDHRRLRSMLADSLPGGRREAQRLAAAAEEGIPREILTAGSDPTGAVRMRLARRLQDERDMTAEAADWTIDSWAAALDVDLGGLTPAYGGEVTRTVPSNPDDDLPPPASRRTVLVAGGLVAAAAAAIVLLVVLNPFGGTGQADPSATATPTAEPASLAPSPSQAAGSAVPSLPPTSTPTPTPTISPTDRLLARLDSPLRASCEAFDLEEFADDGALARVSCEVQGLDALHYLLFANVDDMNTVYDDVVPVPSNTGSCPSDTPSERSWFLRGFANQPRGRLSCFVDRDQDVGWIIWTTDSVQMLAWGNRADRDLRRLYDRWTDGDLVPSRNPD